MSGSRRSAKALCTVVLGLALAEVPLVAQDPARDALRELQLEAVSTASSEQSRLFAFGWQGLESVFSTHTTHSNRMVPLLTFGGYSDLGALTGPNSAYRSEARLREIFGQLPPGTLDGRQEGIDQTEIHRLMRSAVERGCKRIVVLLLDGGDWQAHAAASVALHGTFDPEGLGAGLSWFEFTPPGSALGLPSRDEAFVVTTPLRGSVPPGYDLRRGGRFPWSDQDPAYLAGEFYRGPAGRPTAARGVHAVVDSAASATAILSGRKTSNGQINTAPNGEPFTPIGLELQGLGFTVATVTDVPFDHASPACVYARAESRKLYPDIGAQMVGQSEFVGLDLVLGYGFESGEDGQQYLRAEDLEAARGSYRVVTPIEGLAIEDVLPDAAARTAEERRENAAGQGGSSGPGRLFGFFGRAGLDHAPYRTADGRYDPVPGIGRDGGAGAVETYDEALLREQPTLLQMTRAATTVLDATPDAPFFLFVEAGLVDWSLHANNLDNAVGEVQSAEEVFDHLSSWISERGWWEETLLVVTSDHGHLLQVDFEGLQARLR